MYRYTPPRKPREKPLASVFVGGSPLAVSPDGEWHSTGYWALRDVPMPAGRPTQELLGMKNMLLKCGRNATQRVRPIGELGWTSGSLKAVPVVVFSVTGEAREAIVVNRRYLDHCMSYFPRAEWRGSRRDGALMLIMRNVNDSRPRVVGIIMPLIWSDGSPMGEQVQTLLKESHRASTRK